MSKLTQSTLLSTILSKLTLPTVSSALVFIFLSSNVTAQQTLLEYLNGNSTKKTKATVSTKRTSEAGKRAPAKAAPTKQAPARVAKKVDIKTARKLFTVTFITSEPYAEIWLNDKKSGQSDQDSKFEKKIAAGEYRVMARNKFRVIFPMTRISVSGEQTTFKLFEENKPAAMTETTDKTVEKKKTSEELAMEVSAEVKRILQDYADPKKTDSISTSDWELVYKAAQYGQLQGFSLVDIEAQRWFSSGQMELAQQNFTNAFTAFNKAMEFMPTSGLLFYAIGNTYMASKQPADALKAYQRSLQLTPKMGMTYKRLGDAYRILGKEKEAISAYRNAVQYGYDNVETKFGLALTLMETKQLEDAVTQLVEVEKEKQTTEVYLALGEAYERTKRDVSAIENYQKAIQAAPNSPVAYFKLGDVYYSQREYTKAKETYEKAIQLDPEGKILNKNEAQKKLREAASKIK